jgi:hypothetical protein
MSMNSGRLVHREVLANGLTLELWDHSRPVAGDRWYTRLEARINMAVREQLPEELKDQEAEVVAALGEDVVFARQEERNFISAAEHPGVLQDMQDRILALAPAYYGHQDFGAKFIYKKYAAYRERGRE